MTTPNNRIVADLNLDDIRAKAVAVKEHGHAGQWYSRRITATKYMARLYDATSMQDEARHFVTAVRPDHPCWTDDMTSYAGLGVWTDDGVTTEVIAEHIASACPDTIIDLVERLQAARAYADRLVEAIATLPVASGNGTDSSFERLVTASKRLHAGDQAARDHADEVSRLGRQVREQNGALSDERCRFRELQRFCDARLTTLNRIADQLGVVHEDDKILAAFERQRQERYDALSVRSKEGLLSSEWILRTGQAERERDEALAKVDAFRATNERLSAELRKANTKLAPVESERPEHAEVRKEAASSLRSRGLTEVDLATIERLEARVAVAEGERDSLRTENSQLRDSLLRVDAENEELRRHAADPDASKLANALANYRADHGARCEAKREWLSTVAESACRLLGWISEQILLPLPSCTSIAFKINDFLSAPDHEVPGLRAQVVARDRAIKAFTERVAELVLRVQDARTLAQQHSEAKP